MKGVPRNWDQYYADPAHVDCAPDPLLVQAADLLAPGHALDLACGAGRHALHLARLGWHVTAVDSSPVAIQLLRTRSADLPIDPRVADLEHDGFAIARDTYDLVCDFYYLQRNLFTPIGEAVRPGGVFIGAIHLFDTSAASQPRNPDFLLHPGELRAYFDGWKVIFYSEAGEPDRARPTARIIARRA